MKLKTIRVWEASCCHKLSAEQSLQMFFDYASNSANLKDDALPSMIWKCAYRSHIFCSWNSMTCYVETTKCLFFTFCIPIVVFSVHRIAKLQGYIALSKNKIAKLFEMKIWTLTERFERFQQFISKKFSKEYQRKKNPIYFEKDLKKLPSSRVRKNSARLSPHSTLKKIYEGRISLFSLVKVVTKICLTWKLLLLTILKLINRDFELTVLFSYVIHYTISFWFGQIAQIAVF